MGIKRYILLSVIYLLAIGLYVYSFNGDTYALTVYTFSLDLPIALWIVLPAIVLLAASITHMMYYSFKDFLHNRALKKDFQSFKTSLGRKVLGEDEYIAYRTEWFRFVGRSLKILSYKNIPDDVKIGDEDIVALSKIVEDINSGKVVDMKKYKLSMDNELRVQNKINQLKEDPKYATTILKENEDKDSELSQMAYFEYLKYASFEDIKKLNFTPTKEIFRIFMERYLDEEDSFDMDLASIEELLTQFKANREDYLELAREIKVKLDPDAMIALFEKLYNSTENLAADAYLYVLYELQMIEKIREILDNSEEDEFIKFKTLLFLRDNGKHIDSGMFLSV